MTTKPKSVRTVPVKAGLAKSPSAPRRAVPNAATEPANTSVPVVAAIVQKVTVTDLAKTSTPPIGKVVSMASDSLKKKDLIDRVLLLTGGKKKTVRDIVEATLNVLGDALSKGEMLNLPPFGKAKVSRPSDAASGRPMTVKLRRGQGGGQGRAKGKQALAEIDG